MAHVPPPVTGITISETQDTATLHRLAHATWHPTYQQILSPAQIDYMLEQLYTQESLRHQMEEGQTFLLLCHQGTPAAFAAFSLYHPAEQVYKLNKIYIHPEYQGKGYGRLLLNHVMARARALGGKHLELNVHRHNPAQHFYARHGFEITQTVDIPFGPFTLHDYIMRRPL
ncbi:GNAT family N-acetyltransferase [Rufibacter ruber]|uniref:GNAT family N-acetyltransferase n=1 Tax=Rufibacter ruber TaxID=1783499 RepID=UPI000833061E|nr:GNAT family N-acetyltransferase [Rufibacter ruber]